MLSEYVKKLQEVKEAKKETLPNELKQINAEEEYLEQIVIEKIRAEGIEKGETEDCFFYIKHEAYPNITSWEDFLNWVLFTGNYYLLSKSINRQAWKEGFFDKNEEVPGIKPFEKDVIQIRKKSKKGGEESE